MTLSTAPLAKVCVRLWVCLILAIPKLNILYSVIGLASCSDMEPPISIIVCALWIERGQEAQIFRRRLCIACLWTKHKRKRKPSPCRFFFFPPPILCYNTRRCAPSCLLLPLASRTPFLVKWISMFSWPDEWLIQMLLFLPFSSFLNRVMVSIRIFIQQLHCIE